MDSLQKTNLSAVNVTGQTRSRETWAIEDEIEDLDVCETFVNDKGAPPQKYYNLNTDQIVTASCS